jgi:hypothetical protein
MGRPPLNCWFVRSTGPDGKMTRRGFWLSWWPAMDTANDSISEPFKEARP